MTEDFLQYAWKYRLYNKQDLKSISGDDIKVLHPGEHNSDSGPDFFNARIKIGTTTWAGNVEVHVKASDWKKHKHQSDKAYGNLVLHVVYEHDLKEPIDGVVATLELNKSITKETINNYERIQNSKDWIPCGKQLVTVNTFTLNTWLERLLVERLEQKSNYIISTFNASNSNWEEAFYRHLARSFGFKVNAEPFELLAKSISNNTLAKHKDSLAQIEALLFGVAGLLDKQFNDAYAIALQNEYAFLKRKLKLKSIDTHLWKFMRLRPNNFPTVRLAQFAQLIYKSKSLFSKIAQAKDVNELKSLLSVTASPYWNTHYNFDKASGKKEKTLGDSAIENLIINAIVPFLFIYGKQTAQEEMCEKAFGFLEKLQSEDNVIVKGYKRLGVKVKSASRSQSYIQLKTNYCDKKRCLSCSVGMKLIASQV